MRISVIGLGWFGEDLARELIKEGHEVQGTTTTIAKKEAFIREGINAQLLSYPVLPNSSLLKTDIVILNIPPFPEELSWFKSWAWEENAWLIFISSTSGGLIDQEEWVKSTFRNWTILRFGGLYGKERHPGKSLSGRQNLPGRHWPVNLLHLSDAIGFTKKVIELKLSHTIFPVLSADHPSREMFYREYCLRNNLALPDFDQTDQSQKTPVSNKESAVYYKFKELLFD